MRWQSELAKKHDIKVMCNYQMAWWPANYAAKTAGGPGRSARCGGCTASWGTAVRVRKGVRSKYFFEWLTDPVKNGAGALMDFGCYNALWSLWYMGRPESVYRASPIICARRRSPKWKTPP